MVEATPMLLSARSQHQGKHSVPFSVKGVPLVNRFIGRDAELQRLEDYFHPKTPGPTRRKVFVTHGLGGIGKTQLAIEFARTHHSRYSAVFWLDGSSKDRLEQFFVEAAYRLPLDQVTADIAEALKQSKDIDVDIVVEGVLRWMSLPSNQHWLLVIDNVDRDHLSKDKDPQAYDVKEFFPLADHGSILITSRLASLQRYGESVKVDSVNDKQAKAILENNADKPIKDADLIIERLNGLPLALTQAGSYLRYTNMAALDYVKYYDSTWGDLMKKQDRFPLQEYAYRSVLTTWTISYEQVRDQSEEAASLLKLWGFLDCRDIWYELISTADLGENMPGWLQRLGKNKLEFSDALQVLTHYSLVDAREETLSYSMHSVLHAWCSQLAEHEERETLCWVAAGLVASIVPKEAKSEYWKIQKRLLPHGSRVYRALDENCSEPLFTTSNWNATPWIFFNLGVLFDHHGRLNAGVRMYLRALAIYEKTLGVEHISTLDTLNNLGVAYSDLDKTDEAERAYMRALTGYEKALGADHESVLRTVNNLGNLYQVQNKPDEAERMYTRALAEYEKAFSAEHKGTLDTVHNLGILYTDQGKLDEAERTYMRALAGYKKTRGIDHEATLRTAINLGNLYQKQGKLDEAEKMYLQALAGYEKTLSTEHVLTLRTANRLGNLYKNQSKLNEAESMYMQGTSRRKRRD
ncbi:hypothetical protein LTR66_011682 [Elasticomyces elasticus]|nr:hypothetical protein LTR66_011682 [Elasticomyces elasticus]